MDYRVFSALIQVPNLDQLEKYEAGLYDKQFIAKVVAAVELGRMVESHSSDAQYVPPKKGKGR